MVKKEKLKKWAINRFLYSFRNSDELEINNRLEADKRLDSLCMLAITRAGFAGAISGMLVSLIAFGLFPWESKSDSNNLMIAIIISISGVVMTSIELLFLYRDSLGTAARMAKVLGIPDEELNKIDLEQSMPRWLIYAAMGAPGHRGVLFGIDPLAKIGKYGLIIRKILTKIRVIGSASLFKSILRRIWVRMIGRVATRATVNLLALPIFVILNILGMRHTMNEMRSRLVGYELTPKIISHAFPEGIEKISSGLNYALQLGISEQIMNARYIHPNQIRILEILGVESVSEVEIMNSHNSEINEEEQRRADRFLIAISTTSGKNNFRHRRLSKDIENRLGREEASLVREEVWDAIHDLKPFSRKWT